jgi:hypothetical protein
MTKEEIEKKVSKGTTDYGRVTCLYFNEKRNFCLVKWPGGYEGRHWCRSWVPAIVKIYNLNNLSCYSGTDIWCCGKDNDGRLTKKRLQKLIEKWENNE